MTKPKPAPITPARWLEPMLLDDLLDAKRNPKGHAVEAISASIGRFGMVEQIVLDERTGRIVGGHGRRNELRRLRDAGLAAPEGVQVDANDGTWWPYVVRGWRSRDDADAEACAIALNRAGELGGWTPELAQVLGDLAATDDGLIGVGFTDDALQSLIAENARDAAQAAARAARAAGVDDDDAPALPAEPDTVSKLGDVWQLGDHRLVVGDAQDAAVFEKLLGDERVVCVWTDPPYGVAIVGGNHSLSPEERARRGGKTIQNDDLDEEQLRALLDAAFTNAVAACVPGATWFVAAPGCALFGVFGAALAAKGIWRHTLIWLKDSLVLSRADYHYRHEPLLYGWVPGGAHHAPPTRTGDTVWEFPRPKRSSEHPTMKPVGLVARALENHTDPGDLVLDPFTGSGTTLLAAHRLGRRARCVEKDPRYADVVARRWQRMAGQVPLLNGKKTRMPWSEDL